MATKKTTGKASHSTKKPAKTPLLWKADPGPSLYVNSVTISGDGSKLIGGTFYFDYSKTSHSVSGSQPFTVGVYAYSKTQALLWKDEFPASEGVYWVGVSRDGSWASAGGLELHGQGFISIYNAANGTKSVDYKIPARTNMVAFNSNGSCLVAGGDKLYIFFRNGANWNAVPQIINCVQPTDSVISVAISADGSWIVAGTLKGTVMLIKNTGGVLAPPVTWQHPIGSIHWIAMAANGSAFVAGGSGSSVYYFTIPGFQTNPDAAWTGALTGCNSCRSVAISDDGSVVSAVANKASAGVLFLFNAAGALTWSKATQYSPNSTSLDSAGKFVTVAEGYPDATPGLFSLYDANGTSVWNYPATNMSWPMQISASADGVAAGSDDSYMYYFKNS
jgi:WD40 repeat protein